MQLLGVTSGPRAVDPKFTMIMLLALLPSSHRHCRLESCEISCEILHLHYPKWAEPKEQQRQVPLQNRMQYKKAMFERVRKKRLPGTSGSTSVC